MNRGTQWGKLEFNESDEYYEAMLPDYQLLEKWDEEHEGGGQVWSFSLRQLTQQIEDELMSMWKSKVELVYDIGLKLHQFRSVLSYRFEESVNERLPFSYSTACNYINVFKRFDSAQDAALFDSKVMYAMATKNFPYEVRKDMISRAKKGEVVTLEEVRDARDAVRREAASGMNEESNPIEPNKTPYMDLAERIKSSLEDIVSEVEEFSFPDALSENEEWSQLAVWSLLEELGKVFEPDK
ncbi:hypothetical protein SYK_31130 [Pseudodesulfovibrio nedwellii]|uniref:Uncharacterized protein n=1 Tax=Pseudodesulfovibrio nedwellii TaxID=2973072 RepID=A0ABN6S8Q5_9BACT|nr:hypothetical protein [Pseudodesulfovibrio nedwellii]BDQ38753.1 hypothetical protein SYK_31130 [Pseudodesulfovibrio nedwellii]